MRKIELNINRKYLNAGTFLTLAVFNLILCVLLVFRPNFAENVIKYGIFVAIMVISLGYSVEFLFDLKNDGHRFGELGSAVISFIGGVFLFRRFDIFIAILPITIGIFALFTAFAQGVIFYIRSKNKHKRRLVNFIRVLSNTSLGLLMLATPGEYVEFSFLLAGLYFFLVAMRNIFDFLAEIIPPSRKYTIENKIKRKIRITVPSYLSAFIPYNAVEAINDYLRLETDDSLAPKEIEASKADFEIFIHVSPKGLGMVGHVDVCYDDTVLTFGPYDNSWRVLGGLVTSGVLVRVEGKENYLDFCTKYSNKSIFGFGISLDDEQKERVQAEIKEIFDEAYEWTPPAKKEPQKEHDDYASALYTATGAHFYKFASSTFKTYFIANTNCVMLADRITGAFGAAKISLNGFITPGNYYEHLDREYRRKNSIVKTKTIYKALAK